MKESTQQQFVTLDTFNDTLERLIGRFDAVDARFDGVDARFDAIDVKFDEIDRKFEAVDARFESIEVGMATKSGLASLEEKMMQGFEAFDRRVNTLETGLNRSIKTLSLQIQNLALTKADWPEEA